MTDLTQQELKDRIHYDPQTGIFTQRKQTSHRVKVGDRAGCLAKSTGYRVVYIKGRQYYEHRLAWLYMHGEWPPEQIDHINHKRDDNRFSNLRSVTHQQNHFNRANVRGYFWEERYGVYRAHIQVSGKHYHLGHFKTRSEARAAHMEAKARLHSFAEAS